MLQVGDKIPDFTLQDQDGNAVSSSDLIGEPFVIYFYPKDDTPGCTKQACAFRDSLPRFKGVRVIGISPDSVKSHKKFAEKYSLPFTLLSDEGHKVAEMFGVWVEKSLYGKKYWGNQRSTFLFDEHGIVRAVWEKASPDQNVGELVAIL
ncbi:MAG: thioredoxin-dependent thiol peroxidase [Fimbriimonadales bacterium]|nr:thioredoxin-dependent thiol peroxidase [Fimbriimonadales bacterium]